MTQEQAIDTLISAIEIAQQKGAYTLQGAAQILSAIATLKPNGGQPQAENPAE